MILPPYRFLVDESGTADFRPRVDIGRRRAYITCAVSVPTHIEAALLDLLPRDAETGDRLKAQDVRFSDSHAINFVKRLLDTEVDVAVVLVDPAGLNSREYMQDAVAGSNLVRQEAHEQKISDSTMAYALFTGFAIFGAWHIASARRQEMISFADLTFDTASVARVHQCEVQQHFLEESEHQGLCFREVEWKSEREEPLLLAPDLIAGIFHREVTRGDSTAAYKVLMEASRAERIRVEDGPQMYTKPKASRERRES